MKELTKKLAQAGLKINALKLDPQNPFEWSSGYKMPIYNDNRRYLYFPEYRKLVIESFNRIIEENSIDFDVIGGVSTGGIPWGSWLAERLNAPFIYLRGDEKKHGLNKRIEGVESQQELEDKCVLIIEDLISTGSSAIEAITTVREAQAKVRDCLAIFDYELTKSKQNFSKLEPTCSLHSVLTYDQLLQVAIKENAIKSENLSTLKKWKRDPFNWWKNRKQ